MKAINYLCEERDCEGREFLHEARVMHDGTILYCCKNCGNGVTEGEIRLYNIEKEFNKMIDRIGGKLIPLGVE